MTLTVGSLFSGIGGLDLGLERAGMRVIWQSEIDPYACRVLQKHWKDVPNHGNIKEIDWNSVERPDVICGGYPCQPFSTAGKRRGEEDSRHLWPWVREAISRLRPRYAILENVRGHLSLGGLSVIGELASIGYDAEWRIVSAASVGANHKRDRIIIVAYPNSYNAPDGRKCSTLPGENSSWGNDRNRSKCHTWEIGVGNTRENSSYVADSDGSSQQFQQERQVSERYFEGRGEQIPDTDCEGLQRHFGSVYETRQTAVLAWRGWEWWQTEPNVGRVADGIPSRVDRLRGLGNAVVPQVAEVIGRLVVAHAG